MAYTKTTLKMVLILGRGNMHTHHTVLALNCLSIILCLSVLLTFLLQRKLIIII